MKRTHAAFLSIEVLLALSILSLVILGVSITFISSEQATLTWGNRSTALLVAQEGVEAMRSIRNTNFSTLSNGTYGLTQTGGIWALSGASDTLQTGYTRAITVASGSGSNSKEITSTVTWSDPNGQSQNTSVVTRLTNWRTTPPVTGMAANLVVSTTGAVSGGGTTNVSVNGITLQNTGTASITVSSVTITWTGGVVNNRVNRIRINNTTVTAGGLSASSGTLISLTTGATRTIPAGTTYSFTPRWSLNITGATITSIVFLMSDGSSQTVSSFGPV